jgi:WD40 repeat protein
MAFSDDGEWFAAGRDNGSAHAWKISDAEPGGAISLTGHWQQITAIVFVGGDDQQVITASADGTAKLFKIDSGNQQVEALKTFYGNRGPIKSAWVNRKGSRLVTGGEDGTALIWNLENRDDPPSVVAGRDGPIVTGAFDRDGRGLTTVSVDGTVQRWSLDRVFLVQEVDRIVGRPLSNQEQGEFGRRSPVW